MLNLEFGISLWSEENGAWYLSAAFLGWFSVAPSASISNLSPPVLILVSVTDFFLLL